MVLIGAIGLAACGKAPDATPPAGRQAQPTAVTQPNPLTEIRRLAPGAQRAVLFRAINAAQVACEEVTDGTYQQDYKKMAMFVARCPDDGPYAVFVDASGYAQVRACATLAAGVPQCSIDPAAGKR
jgi:type II secretory pathway component PulC